MNTCLFVIAVSLVWTAWTIFSVVGAVSSSMLRTVPKCLLYVGEAVLRWPLFALPRTLFGDSPTASTAHVSVGGPRDEHLA